MMNAAEVDGLDRGTEGDQAAHGVNVACQQNAGALIRVPLIELPARIVRRREVDVHVGRDAHAIQLLLPLAARHLVIDEGDEPQIERLSPSHDDLTVNQAVVDAIEVNGHARLPAPSSVSAPRARRRAWLLVPARALRGT